MLGSANDDEPLVDFLHPMILRMGFFRHEGAEGKVAIASLKAIESKVCLETERNDNAQADLIVDVILEWRSHL